MKKAYIFLEIESIFGGMKFDFLHRWTAVAALAVCAQAIAHHGHEETHEELVEAYYEYCVEHAKVKAGTTEEEKLAWCREQAVDYGKRIELLPSMEGCQEEHEKHVRETQPFPPKIETLPVIQVVDYDKNFELETARELDGDEKWPARGGGPVKEWTAFNKNYPRFYTDNRFWSQRFFRYKHQDGKTPIKPIRLTVTHMSLIFNREYVVQAASSANGPWRDLLTARDQAELPDWALEEGAELRWLGWRNNILVPADANLRFFRYKNEIKKLTSNPCARGLLLPELEKPQEAQSGKQ